MKIEAMVVRSTGGQCTCETLELDEPRADEILVRVVASGICHSDISIIEQLYPFPFPFVLGHEGSGIVEKVGADVTDLRPGDHVILTFNSCGACGNCQDGKVAYCKDFGPLNIAGTRPDGSVTLHKGEEKIFGSFFTQSSFATYALCQARNTIKVDKDLPLELLGPLGCGIQTGAGTVLNVLKPSPESSIVIFGAGAVGLSALMGAKVSGCQSIIAVDRIPKRLDLAVELGATKTIDVSKQDAGAELAALGGVDFAVETSGNTHAVTTAIQALNHTGALVLLAGAKPGVTIPLELVLFNSGRRILGVTEGDADPVQFIPHMIDLYRAGKLPFDKLVKFYDFADINAAIADSLSGATIKPVIRMPSATRPAAH